MENQPQQTSLAPVFVNDERVRLGGDASPPVSKIVAAFGKAPQGAQILRVGAAGAMGGEPLAPDQIIERAGMAKPVYLRVAARPQPERRTEAPRPGAPTAPAATTTAPAAARPAPTTPSNAEESREASETSHAHEDGSHKESEKTESS